MNNNAKSYKVTLNIRDRSEPDLAKADVLVTETDGEVSGTLKLSMLKPEAKFRHTAHRDQAETISRFLLSHLKIKAHAVRTNPGTVGSNVAEFKLVTDSSALPVKSSHYKFKKTSETYIFEAGEGDDAGVAEYESGTAILRVTAKSKEACDKVTEVALSGMKRKLNNPLEQVGASTDKVRADKAMASSSLTAGAKTDGSDLSVWVGVTVTL